MNIMDFNDVIGDLQSEEAIQQIWNKGIIVDGYNADMYRQDFAGAWIARLQYGKKDSSLGWEMDHVYPLSKGGQDHIGNLRPMNWRNNESKGDDYPHYKAVIVSDGAKNVFKDTDCTVNNELQNQLNLLYSIND